MSNEGSRNMRSDRVMKKGIGLHLTIGPLLVQESSRYLEVAESGTSDTQHFVHVSCVLHPAFTYIKLPTFYNHSFTRKSRADNIRRMHDVAPGAPILSLRRPDGSCEETSDKIKTSTPALFPCRITKNTHSTRTAKRTSHQENIWNMRKA